LNPAINLLGLWGSLRRAANSKAILMTLREELAPDISIEPFELGNLPLYNADLEGDALEPVQALKKAISRSEGVLIVTPEYNYGVPGVLKNALDWASRPAYRSVLKDKHVAVISSSPSSTGGARAQGQLKQTLSAVLARTLPWPEVVIGNVADKVREGRLVDEASLRSALDIVRGLAREIRGGASSSGGR
jgi:chromate reductase, NAD(P)H dehydrogenase (quinone)